LPHQCLMAASKASGSSSGRRAFSERTPCWAEFWPDLALPSGVRGPVRPRLGHRRVGFQHRERARAERNLLAAQPVRVAAAVPPLLMVTDEFGGAMELRGRRSDRLFCSPREAVHPGMGLVTENRQAEGLLLPLSVRANLTLPRLPDLGNTLIVEVREQD